MFTFILHVNGHFTRVSSEDRGRAIAVETPTGTRPAPNLSKAVRIASEVLGPLMEPIRGSGSAWGLYVAAGDAAAIFGTFPPTPESPSIAPARSDPNTFISRIYSHWANRDNTPLGALDAAGKIIEHYVPKGRAQRAA